MEKTEKVAKRVQDLEVYRVAFGSAMEIFEISKRFPVEEKYSLTDHMRRLSRSVCANLAEGWRKRKYKAVFTNKLSDAAQEAAETQTWLKFSLQCKYMGLLQNYENVVTPAEAGVQKSLNLLDSRACALQGIRGNDRKKHFQYFCKRPI